MKTSGIRSRYLSSGLIRCSSTDTRFSINEKAADDIEEEGISKRTVTKQQQDKSVMV
jgi:hypothetical protein